MASSPDALQTRLDQLEANMQKWQRTNRVWVWGLLTVITALLIFNPPGGVPADAVHQMLSARQVALVDTQGNVRALLGVHKNGSPFLRLEAGQGTATLAVRHDGTAMLMLKRDGQVVGRLP